MNRRRGVQGSLILVFMAVLAGQLLFWGCQSLCTNRLIIFRDRPEKSLPPEQTALLVTNPAILAALFPAEAEKLKGGLPWAEERPDYPADVYRLSVLGVDGRPVYQGLCLDTQVTDVCEVRPGDRVVQGQISLYGPWGRQNLKNDLALDLAGGGVYFLHPDWSKIGQKNFFLQAARLPEGYNREVRARLVDWQRRHTTGRTLEN